MGADFTLALCEIAVPKSESIRRLKTFTLEDYSTLFDNACEYHFDETGDDLVLSQCYDYVLNALEVVWSCYNEQHREAMSMSLDDKWYVVTGGMSYGDDPTDCYSSINLIDTSDLCQFTFGKVEYKNYPPRIKEIE